MSELSQEGRIGKLTTPVGGDTFVLSRFEGAEGLGTLFEFRVGALSEQADFNLDQLIGRNCNVRIKAIDGLDRHYNGVIVEANYTGGQYGLHGYQFVLRPWLFLLSKATDWRIFSSMKAPQIIEKVFSDRGFNDFRLNLKDEYPIVTYITQYRETDLNFVCRLMEEYGIYYYFEHTESEHTMVLCDAPGCHEPVSGLQPVPLLPATVDTRRDRQQLDSWSSARALQTGKDVVNSYFWKKPTADYLGKSDKHGGYEHADLETYDYETYFSGKSSTEKYAKVRIEAVQAQDDHRVGIGVAPSLTPGFKFTHSENAVAGDNKEYVVLRCTHSYVDQTYISGSAAPSAYAGTYEAMDSSRQFRSPLTTRRPTVAGVQSALVVADKGNESEEIDVDKNGCILVKFYWDRKKDLSRRIRVAQFWGGKSRGAWFCPRLGDEVLIAYEDGDPDRPLVVGSVYNGENEVPTTLPAKKTHSGILTKSSKNSEGYHMLMFDDTVNQERVKLRSQKDLMFKALNNEQRDILMCQTENIGKDETINIGMDMANDIAKGGGNWTLNAFKTATINVGPKEMPLTSITMTQQDITLSVGPEGLFAKIVMNATGITFTVMGGLTTHSWTPASTSLMSPTINELALAAISMVAPAGVTAAATLNTPVLVAGAGTVGGLPLI